MASMVDLITVRAGVCPAIAFASSGITGDWQTFQVPFQPWMPAGAEGRIRVVVSASDHEADVTDHQAVPVVVVGEVSHMGFTAWVRNSDVSPGQSGMNWIAIAEVGSALRKRANSRRVDKCGTVVVFVLLMQVSFRYAQFNCSLNTPYRSSYFAATTPLS